MMRKRFDLYGSCVKSLDEVKVALESRLGRKFGLHESGYLGGEYYRAAFPPEEVIIQRHLPDSEGYIAEPEFAAFSILVYINNSTRWAELDSLMKHEVLVLLRSQEI